MVTVGGDDPPALGINPVANGLVFPGVGPHRALDLEIEAQFVRRHERRLGRAPRVKADQVQAMRFAHRDDALPIRHVRRRVTGQREDAAFQGAAEKDRVAVEAKLLAVGGDLAQAERYRAGIADPLARELQREGLQSGAEFVPARGLGVQRHAGLDAGASGLPRHGHRPGAQGQGPVSRPAGGVAQAHPHMGRLARHVRKDLDIGDPNRAGRGHLQPSDQAVPVSLRVIADAMRPIAHCHPHPVVDPRREGVSARRQGHAEFVSVGRREAVVGAYLAPIHPQARFPVRPLQGDEYAPPRPGGRDVKVALIPRRADIMFLGLEAKRHLDVSRLAVLGILFSLPPSLDVGSPGPRRVHRDIVAKPLVLQRPRQLKVVRQLAVEPMPRQADIGAVELEAPSPRQRNGVRGRRPERGQAEAAEKETFEKMNLHRHKVRARPPSASWRRKKTPPVPCITVPLNF